MTCIRQSSFNLRIGERSRLSFDTVQRSKIREIDTKIRLEHALGRRTSYMCPLPHHCPHSRYQSYMEMPFNKPTGFCPPCCEHVFLRFDLYFISLFPHFLISHFLVFCSCFLANPCPRPPLSKTMASSLGRHFLYLYVHMRT